MDLVQLKKDFGDQLTLMGGIDTRAMADPDPSVIEKEISTKIPFVKKGVATFTILTIQYLTM